MKYLLAACLLTSCAALMPGDDTEPDPTAQGIAQTVGTAAGGALGGPVLGAALGTVLGAAAGYFVRRPKNK